MNYSAISSLWAHSHTPSHTGHPKGNEIPSLSTFNSNKRFSSVWETCMSGLVPEQTKTKNPQSFSSVARTYGYCWFLLALGPPRKGTSGIKFWGLWISRGPWSQANDVICFHLKCESAFRIIIKNSPWMILKHYTNVKGYYFQFKCHCSRNLRLSWHRKESE